MRGVRDKPGRQRSTEPQQLSDSSFGTGTGVVALVRSRVEPFLLCRHSCSFRSSPRARRALPGRILERGKESGGSRRPGESRCLRGAGRAGGFLERAESARVCSQDFRVGTVSRPSQSSSSARRSGVRGRTLNGRDTVNGDGARVSRRVDWRPARGVCRRALPSSPALQLVARGDGLVFGRASHVPFSPSTANARAAKAWKGSDTIPACTSCAAPAPRFSSPPASTRRRFRPTLALVGDDHIRPLRALNAGQRGRGRFAGRQLPRAGFRARQSRDSRYRSSGFQRCQGVVGRTARRARAPPESRSTRRDSACRAEREGFEPSTSLTTRNGFRDRRIRPLCHLSERRTA